jgi:small subunit ribosomal protein S21
MVEVVVKFDNIDYSLKKLKKIMQREGIFRTFKLKRFYEKPSERKVRVRQESQRRRRKIDRKRNSDYS